MSILNISPLPIVNLNSISTPHPGLVMQASAFCVRQFLKDEKCGSHYADIAKNTPADLTPCQCPFGLTSFPITLGSDRLAITGVVPFPRSGGEQERQRAKEHPDVKISIQGVARAREVLLKAREVFDSIEAIALNQQAMALHEIRKLNRTIKQNAERYCISSSPADPNAANAEIVAIWKAAELMSSQFDILELLANESLVTLPLKAASHPYKVFDKLIRIFRQATSRQNIEIKAPGGYYPQVRVCDKTFPILASVLLENAIKYSVGATPIVVSLSPIHHPGAKVRIEIENVAIDSAALDQRIFQKGVRAATDTDGTGRGLYLAQLVAQQHNSIIMFSKERADTSGNHVRCRFHLDMDTIH
jgi:signal transduction histidine kinase